MNFPGGFEWLVILAVALLVVGPKRLPEVGKTVGKALREFRKAQEDLRDSFSFDLDDSKPSPPPARPAADHGVQTAPDASPAAEPADADEAE